MSLIIYYAQFSLRSKIFIGMAIKNLVEIIFENISLMTAFKCSYSNDSCDSF